MTSERVFNEPGEGRVPVRVKVEVETTLYVVPGTTLERAGSKADLEMVLLNLSSDATLQLAQESVTLEPGY